MPGFKSSEQLHLFEFIGTEETNLLVSMLNLRQEINAIAHLDSLYQAAVGKAEIPQTDAIILQCLLYCHYHLYFSTATLLRRHLSEAFASVRTAIEASLHALPAGGASISGMDDLEAVAVAYRTVREAGHLDYPARLAADAAYLRLHPGTPDNLETHRYLEYPTVRTVHRWIERLWRRLRP